ncbi:hypothetical protein B0H13DRAFT_2580535 [Mycena leptocephala]|nr:hypothetical protein B0H13DRAFT_2580535 [Mycena leptocephala]
MSQDEQNKTRLANHVLRFQTRKTLGSSIRRTWIKLDFHHAQGESIQYSVHRLAKLWQKIVEGNHDAVDAVCSRDRRGQGSYRIALNGSTEPRDSENRQNREIRAHGEVEIHLLSLCKREAKDGDDTGRYNAIGGGENIARAFNFEKVNWGSAVKSLRLMLPPAEINNEIIRRLGKPSRQLDTEQSRKAEQLLKTKCVLQQHTAMTLNLDMLEMCEWEIADVEKYCSSDFHIEATDDNAKARPGDLPRRLIVVICDTDFAKEERLRGIDPRGGNERAGLQVAHRTAEKVYAVVHQFLYIEYTSGHLVAHRKNRAG